jgi:hypothetical protein
MKYRKKKKKTCLSHGGIRRKKWNILDSQSKWTKENMIKPQVQWIVGKKHLGNRHYSTGGCRGGKGEASVVGQATVSYIEAQLRDGRADRPLLPSFYANG